MTRGDRINRCVRERLSDELRQHGLAGWTPPDNREYALNGDVFELTHKPPSCDAWACNPAQGILVLVQIEAHGSRGGVRNAGKLLAYVERGGVFHEKEDVFRNPPAHVLEGIKKDLDAIGKKIVGAGIGKVGEAITIKDLQSAFTEDEFTDKRSDEKGSDIIAEVRDKATAVGKVVVSVKYQEKWSGSFLNQLKDDMASEGTRWGMLVTKVFPSNALNDRAYLTKDGHFIVKPEYASVAYYGLREAVRSAWEP